MAVVFQIALLVVAYVQQRWGSPGVLASAVALGITDIDALTVSMSRIVDGPGNVRLAARAICLGILASLVFKIALTAAVGESKFRRLAAAGLGLLLAAGTIGFLLGGRSP
jgi:uncharacterized membrane protein (DUF4010 family)